MKPRRSHISSCLDIFSEWKWYVFVFLLGPTPPLIFRHFREINRKTPTRRFGRGSFALAQLTAHARLTFDGKDAISDWLVAMLVNQKPNATVRMDDRQTAIF